MAAISNLTSTSANAIAIGPNGNSNPTFKVNANTASAATGFEVVGKAAGDGLAVRAVSSGQNENLTLDAKGSGTVTVNGTATGAISLARNTSVAGTFAASGNVAINTDKFTITAASGNTAVGGTLAVTGAATLSSTLGVTGNVAVNTDKFTVTAASGNTLVAGTLGVTGNVAINTDKLTVTASSGALVSASSIKSSAATAGIGYATGAGGTVTQATSKSTGVTLSKASGEIVMHNAELADGAVVTFEVTNTAVAATDVVIVNHASVGTAGHYQVWVSAIGSGTYKVSVRNVSGGAKSEAIKLNVALIKAVAA